MNDRQRFVATMHYRSRDRAPICDFGFWPETIETWHAEGLPSWVPGGHDTRATNKYFGMDGYSGGPHVCVGLMPAFEERIIDDRGDHELVRQSNGVIVLRKKFMGSIPMHHSHLLVDRQSWNEHYKPRLNANDPRRLPQSFTSADDVPRTVDGGSLYGWLRDWMGMENLAMLVYDDPTFFEEMVETIADCIIGVLRKALKRGARFDACGMWEDMCYSSGPLLSPAHFKRFLVPHYERITGLLRSHGTEIVWVDCDGKIDELIPLWLDAGVNCMFPIEVGTWHADPIEMRKTYGRELRLMGGFDKHILAHSPRAIENEVTRLAPLVEEGGYIPFADHRVPPDVPLENYLCYLRAARHVWGHDVNLKLLMADDVDANCTCSALAGA